jgi:hypothetical protein
MAMTMVTKTRVSWGDAYLRWYRVATNYNCQLKIRLHFHNYTYTKFAYVH